MLPREEEEACDLFLTEDGWGGSCGNRRAGGRGLQLGNVRGQKEDSSSGLELARGLRSLHQGLYILTDGLLILFARLWLLGRGAAQGIRPTLC